LIGFLARLKTVIKLACGLSGVDGVFALHVVLLVLISSDSEKRNCSKVLRTFVVVTKIVTTTRRSHASFLLAPLTAKYLLGQQALARSPAVLVFKEKTELLQLLVLMVEFDAHTWLSLSLVSALLVFTIVS
jgi:hypothetical protein